MQAKESRRVFEAIRVHDPAIDWERMRTAEEPLDMAGFRQLREPDEKRHARLILFEGEQVMRFRYRRLTRPQFQNWISTATNEQDRAIKAFQAAIVEIAPPGAPVVRPEHLSRGALVMSEQDLREIEEQLGLEWFDLVDVGDQILSRSEVPLDCTPRWRVPPSLVPVWVAAYLRSAERSQGAAASISGVATAG